MNDPKPSSPLPGWDLSSIYPGFDSDEFTTAVDRLETDIAALATLVAHPSLSPRWITRILARYNPALDLAEIVEGYAACRLLVNSADEPARYWASRTRQVRTELQHSERRLMTLAAAHDAVTENSWSEILRDHVFAIQQARVTAAHMLSPDEEDLALKLNESGGSAWERLRHQTVDAMTVTMGEDGVHEVPLVMLQQRRDDPDRAVRADAYRLEIAAWDPVAPTIGAALNSIKGEALVVSQHRGWATPLDQSLHENRIDCNVLNAMLSAAEDSLPDMRRYLRTKARAVGVPQLAWYDLYAPVASDVADWPLETARELIVNEFGRYSKGAQQLVEMAFSRSWIDAESRPNQRGGGVCVAVGGGRSRILINYNASFDGLRMFAHELGHAYHNWIHDQAGRTAVQRWMTPWVLSETAAIFFETLVRDAVVQASDHANRLAAVESNVQILCRRVVEILNAFRFEQRLFERRKDGALSVDQIKELTTTVQRETYGDSLDHDALHPFMWAVLPHYYTTESSFNNYPYMFGTLFSLGLYARFQTDPAGFSTEFDDFLSLTGMADTATLAGRFGIDLRSPEFWHSGIHFVRQDIDRFEMLIQDRDGTLHE
ncbi:M3 family oligoendopeptidase [soil metagenome]